MYCSETFWEGLIGILLNSVPTIVPIFEDVLVVNIPENMVVGILYIHASIVQSPVPKSKSSINQFDVPIPEPDDPSKYADAPPNFN
jgi:hypothetical protein